MTKLAIINPGGITNFGERAIMLGTVYTLRGQYPDASIAIFGYETLRDEDPHLYQELDRLGVTYYPSILHGGKFAKAIRALAMFVAPRMAWPKASYTYLQDALVFSKGQETLTESYGFVHFLDSALEQLLVSRFNRHVILFGQSIGPVRKHRRLARWILRRFARIHVRDSRSLQVVHGLGYPADRVEQIRDLAYEAVRRYRIRPRQGAPYYLLIPNAAICTTRTFEREYMANMGTLIRKLLRTDANVVIASSVTDSGWNNDYRLCERLHQESGATELRHYKELRELLGDIKGARRVISSRLHPLIMATGMEVPVLALSRSPKIIGLLGDLSLGDCVVDPYKQLNKRGLAKAL